MKWPNMATSPSRNRAIKARSYNLDLTNPHTVEEDHGDPAELLAKLEQSETETAKLRDRLKAILGEALLR